MRYIQYDLTPATPLLKGYNNLDELEEYTEHLKRGDGVDYLRVYTKQLPGFEGHVYTFTNYQIPEVNNLIDARDWMEKYTHSKAFNNINKASGIRGNPYTKLKRIIIDDKDRPDVGSSVAYPELGVLILGLNPSKSRFPDGTPEGKLFSFTVGIALPHEYGHLNTLFNSMDKNGKSEESPYYGHDYKNVPSTWKQYLTPDTNVVNDHDRELNEHYSDLMSVKAAAAKEGIYDAATLDPTKGDVFTLDMLKRLKESESGKKLRYFQYHTDDDKILKAFNNIARNAASATSDLAFAKHGGSLNYLNYIK